jgi:hypothetical protein
MSVNETIQDIRARLKAIKEAVAVIELRLSQLESQSQAPPVRNEAVLVKRPPGVEQVRLLVVP